ncbi:MAG: FixH family protein, partial [Gemmatimonadetes bacterium]|nr:FixH family protein [Gemmatimonadota bacterium]
MNAPTDARSTPARGLFWPALILLLLAGNACIVAATIYLATSDGSFGVEPDYYRKAVEWDQSARLRRQGERLGWTVESSLAPPSRAGEPGRLEVRLLGPQREAAERASLDGAAVEFEVFAHARSADRQRGTLTDLGGGKYAGAVRIDRAGVWEVRLTIHRGSETL